MMNPFQIKVPGSTSNIGPGFDSIGIALDLYLTLRCFPSDEWEFIQMNEELQSLPPDKENMIYEVAHSIAKKKGFSDLPPYRVEVRSEIPLARGLGSSGAVTVAGVELANRLLNLNMSIDEKIIHAAEIEGHPDNVTPSYLGGCVIAYYNEKELFYIRKEVLSLDFVTIIPDFELKTKSAREVLPKELSFSKSIEGSAIANVASAAIMAEDYNLLGKIIEKELFHQPYRKKLIPHMDEIVKFMEKEGAYGTFLSGAGPTIISLMEVNKANKKITEWQKTYPNLHWKILKIESQGIEIRDLLTTENQIG
jgi:homoserine kinase